MRQHTCLRPGIGPVCGYGLVGKRCCSRMSRGLDLMMASRGLRLVGGAAECLGHTAFPTSCGSCTYCGAKETRQLIVFKMRSVHTNRIAETRFVLGLKGGNCTRQSRRPTIAHPDPENSKPVFDLRFIFWFAGSTLCFVWEAEGGGGQKMKLCALSHD